MYNFNNNDFFNYNYLSRTQNLEMYNMQNMMNTYQNSNEVYNRPLVFNVKKMAMSNMNFKDEIWKGTNIQVCLMHLNPGENLGIKTNENQDQFIHIIEGQGLCLMGENSSNLNYKNIISEGSCIIIPTGTYYDLVNTGAIPIKCFSIYSPPNKEEI